MDNEKKTKRWLGHIEHWQIIAVFMALYDFLAICISYFIALWIRFMFRTRKSEKISLDFA